VRIDKATQAREHKVREILTDTAAFFEDLHKWRGDRGRPRGVLELMMNATHERGTTLEQGLARWKGIQGICVQGRPGDDEG
jgi:hypothetical protein